MKDCIRERENIEWSNTWIANADKEGPRCLLIGDSVTREIRAELDRFLFHKFSIDLFAASYALNEAMLWRGIGDVFGSGLQV